MGERNGEDAPINHIHMGGLVYPFSIFFRGCKQPKSVHLLFSVSSAFTDSAAKVRHFSRKKRKSS